MAAGRLGMLPVPALGLRPAVVGGRVRLSYGSTGLRGRPGSAGARAGRRRWLPLTDPARVGRAGAAGRPGGLPPWMEACRGPIPAPLSRHGNCGCRRPLVWDGQWGMWRHLADGTMCAAGGTGLWPWLRLVGG